MSNTNAPTAGTGNTMTNASGKISAGSQFTDKPQRPGDPAVAEALVAVVDGHVDLDTWEPGEDVDADAQVKEELEAARLTPGYDYEGDDQDLYEWEPGEDVDADDLVAEELSVHRTLSLDQVDLGTWLPGAEPTSDTRVSEELKALRTATGSGGRTGLNAWVAGADQKTDDAVFEEVRALRRLRRRNRNAGL